MSDDPVWRAIELEDYPAYIDLPYWPDENPGGYFGDDGDEIAADYGGAG